MVSFTFDSGKKKDVWRQQIKNLREQISVKVPNREARKKFTGGDKTNLNESGVENVGRKLLTVPYGGIL